MEAVNHLKVCRGLGLLVAPEWKSSPFYPYLQNVKDEYCNVTVWSFKGSNIFKKGFDKDTYFGPQFNCAVNVWRLDFTV